MFDFDAAEKEINNRTPLVNDIDNLLGSIQALKKFHFDESEITFDTQTLLLEKVVIKTGTAFYCQQNQLFIYKAFKFFATHFNYTLTAEINDLFSFLKRIDDFFDRQGEWGVYEFASAISSIALYQQYISFNPGYTEFISKWEQDSDNDFPHRFTDAFCSILPYTRFEKTKLLEILCSLYIFHGYGTESMINIHIADINEALRNYSIKEPADAKQLLVLVYENYTPVHEALAHPLLTGLFQSDKTFFRWIQDIIKIKERQPSIISSLSMLPEYSKNDLVEVSAILSAIDLSDRDNQLQLPGLYTRILHQYSDELQELTDKIISGYGELITSIDAGIAQMALQHLRIMKFNERVFYFLNLMISTNHFDPKLAKVIAVVLAGAANSDIFFRFIEEYSRKFRYDDEDFGNCIAVIRNRHKEQFDAGLVQLLIHDNGKVRFAGGRILNRLSFNVGVKQLQADILTLSSKSQFKMFTSVLSSHFEPKYTLPFILPLLAGTNDFVKESLICRLEILSENYGSLVTDAMKNFFGAMTAGQEQIYARVFSYMTAYADILQMKASVKELNPYYIQAKPLNTFMFNYLKKFRATFNKLLLS